MIISSIPQGATVSVEGMDQSMTETTAKVKASLSKGGEQEYTVKFVRSDNHIGWAVSSLDMDFSAAGAFFRLVCKNLYRSICHSFLQHL